MGHYAENLRAVPSTVHGQENAGTHGMHAWLTMNKCFKSYALK